MANNFLLPSSNETREASKQVYCIVVYVSINVLMLTEVIMMLRLLRLLKNKRDLWQRAFMQS
jgi:hypothetical protein